MAQTQVRTLVAVITTGLALAALLVGPAVTLGLDVPVVGSSAPTTTQVAATTQTVVQTTQQTAATTVTNVESTVQAVQAPAAAAPVTQPVQNTASTVTSAPKQTVTKTAAPVQKKTSAAAPAKSPARQISSKAGVTRQSAGAPAAAIRNATATATHAARTHKLTRSKAAAVAAPAAGTPSRRQHASSCNGLPLLDALPSELSALLSVACDATDILIPARLGTARGSNPVLPVGEVLGIVTNGRLDVFARVAGLQRVLHKLAEQGRGMPSSAVTPPRRGTNAVAGVGASGSHSAKAVGHTGGAISPPAATPSGQHASAHAAKDRHRGLFSQPVDGTGVLSLVLLLDAVLLGALVVWRLAQRWVVPRFA